MQHCCEDTSLPMKEKNCDKNFEHRIKLNPWFDRQTLTLCQRVHIVVTYPHWFP